jgi:hypothetical protein
MKKTSLKTLLVIATCSVGLIFTSCNKEEVEPTTPVITTPVITEPFFAKVDGIEFVETELTGTVSAWTSTLEIKASINSGSQFVKLKMPQTIIAGTYDFADPDAGFRAAYYDDGNSIYGAPTSTGTLVIVSNTAPSLGVEGEIKGTFSFNAEPYAFSSGNDNYSITEGQFSVNY